MMARAALESPSLVVAVCLGTRKGGVGRGGSTTCERHVLREGHTELE